MTLFLYITVILICMCGQAFFAGIETGIISIHRMRLRHLVKHGDPGAALLEQYLENYDRLFGTTLTGTNLSTVTISVVATALSIELVGHKWGETVATVVMSLVILMFCEFLPKAWFHSRPISRSGRFVVFLRMFEVIFKPVSTAVIGITRVLVPGADKSFSSPMPFVTKEDLKILAQEGEKDGILSSKERLMISRVFELSGKKAKDIMVSGSDMCVVSKDLPVSKFLERVEQDGYTRWPVVDPETGNYIGVVNVFYVLAKARGASRDATIGEFARSPIFVKEQMPVDDIFPRLRRFRNPMCFVRNDEEAVVGLITTEDILRTIVGRL